MLLLHLVLLRHQANASDAALRDRLSKRVHFVHVGKTGGGTIRSVLGALCDCTPLQVHVRPVSTKEVSARLIVSVRDPVDRVLSSFNWRHPLRGGDIYCPSRSCGSNVRERELEKELYNCFDTVNDFAEALSQSHFCGLVARRALTEGVGHLGKGFRYYFEDVLHLLPNMTFKLVNTESFDKDLRCALRWLGFPANAVDALEYEHKHREYPGKNETFLSPKARRNLELFLIDDTFYLSELERYADREC